MNDLRLSFVSRALDGIDQLPPSERADYYMVAACILINTHPQQAEAAATAANNLREAESAQLHFRALLSAAQNPQPEARA